MDKDANMRGQLLNAYDDPSGALSNVVRYSREQAFVKVRRATDRHYRKLLSAGRLFEAKFAPGAQLGPEAPQLAGATDYGVASRANASGAVWSNWVSLGGNTKAFAC